MNYYYCDLETSLLLLRTAVRIMYLVVFTFLDLKTNFFTFFKKRFLLFNQLFSRAVIYFFVIFFYRDRLEKLFSCHDA